ncbi:MAG TPA: hypothetical protein DDY04_01820 [Bacteroidales bacterium]|nr:hypothetical protein [Bacteroidales bacterium]
MKKFLVLAMMLSVAFVACEKSEDDDSDDPQKVGIVGEWYSSGTNVAPLLAYLGIDSIYSKFNKDNTYLVESFSDGAKTTLTGTYVQAKSGVGNIWNITLNQNSPTALTSQGIFEIDATKSPYTMDYEVAQTEPPIQGVTPPTASGGFGSTSNGAYGTTNIQKFIKLVR